MERYHDLIVSLIKANRKYPECKDILEDIVADVYEHAQVVLSSVSNESVISSYLSKIVATSVITVSRRLGVQTSRANNFSIPTIADLKPEVQPELTISVTPEQEEIHDTSDDNFEEIEVTDELSDEGILEEISDDNTEFEESEESDLISEEYEDGDFEPETEQVAHDVDKSLVDKMINGISAEEPYKDEEEEDVLNIEEEISDLDSNIDDDLLIEETDITDEIDEGELLPEGETEISEPEEEILEEEEEEDTFVASDDLADIEENEPADLEEVSELTDLEPEQTAILEELEEPEQTAMIEEPEESEQTEEPEEVENQESEDDINLPSYDCFDYSPAGIEIDEDEIKQKINDIQNKHSDTDTLEIYKLKYQDKLSVDEIASKLGLSDENVLEILKELVFIVKD